MTNTHTQPARILAVYNSKGGATKTTTALALAALWSKEGKRVLLVDIDSRFSATMVLNDGPADGATIRHVLADDLPIEDAIREVAPCLHFVASDKGMEATAAVLPHMKAAEVRLSRSLRPILGDYDVVILDCPGGADAVGRNAVVAATHLCVPLNTERRAFDCAVDTIAEADELRSLLDKAALPFRVVLTAFRGTTKNGFVIEAAAKAKWPDELTQTRVRLTEQVKELSSRNALMSDAKAGGVRDDYQALANELAQWMGI